jgi:asparagine synthase (glutamine-hydrolysing)
MCGIAAIYSLKWNVEARESYVSGMLNSMKHRGPDAEGVFSHKNITIGHRRLSIIDLSNDAHQPLHSHDERYVIVFNGEIYNYKQLRIELQRVSAGSSDTIYHFKTQSDTEVILAAYIRWKEKCLQYLKGIFAFVIYDKQTQTLFIARDRLGVKPLYYYYNQDHFIISSEIRSILNHVPLTFNPDKEALKYYLNYQTFFENQTPVKQIKMLPSGHYVLFSKDKKEFVQYYYPSGNEIGIEVDEAEVLKNIREKVFQSVERRLVSDVPVAAFLSGGIDSSIVVSCMAQLSSNPVHTFHVTFEEKAYSEKSIAETVSKKYNTAHINILIRPKDVLDKIQDFANAVDIPSGDGLNTWIISGAVHNQNIRVALSGIGGDEWFMGYNIFQLAPDYLNKKLFLKLLPFIPAVLTDIVFPPKKSIRNAKFHDLVKNNISSPFQLYSQFRSLFGSVHAREYNFELLPLYGTSEIQHLDLFNALSLWEWEYYLKPILLRDTDQFSMAHALEVREPYLDHELVEYSLGINQKIKQQNPGKQLLIKAFKNDLPEDVWRRKKMGFTLPMQEWMKHELKTWCKKHIKSLEDKNIYENASLTKLWNSFLKNDPLVSWTRVWHLVILNHWLDNNKITIE